jgi:hypothetical protein
MRFRVARWVWLIFALFAAVSLPQISSAKSGSNASVKITGFSVTTEAATKHVVTMSGIFTNKGTTALPATSITLATSKPIYTRSELGDILTSPQAVRGITQNAIKVSLGAVKAGEALNWKLRFVGESVLGASASGVFAFGAIATSTQLASSTYVTAPWFYTGASIAPTNVAVAIPLTTTNSHIALRPIRNLASDTTALTRLTELVTVKQAKAVSWMIDPALKQWLQDLSSTELRDPAQTLATRLSELLDYSVLTPYGHANLAGLATSNQKSEIASLMDLGTSSWPGHRTLYASPAGTLSKVTLNQLVVNGVTPMISNAFSVNNAQVTSNAHGTIRGHDVVIFDQAASECLLNKTGTDTAFAQNMCLQSQLGMMTAESPGVSRTVVVLAPAQWALTGAQLGNLLTALDQKQWVSLTSLAQVLALPNTTEVNIPVTAKARPMSPRTLKLAARLKNQTAVVGSMVTDTEWKVAVTPARFLAYSDLWHKTTQAHAYLHGQLQSVQAIASNVTIQSSSQITIASTHAEIPITVANASAHDVKVRVNLRSDTPGKFTASVPPLVNVPIGKRVTVSVPITLTGTGVISATVELVAPNGRPVGTKFDVRISSTAYQKVASILVRLAFGILLLLAVSNFIKRRKKSKPENSRTL